MTKRTSPHIICFAPFTTWSIHSARQVTILQGLRQRGCTVTYVTCDGVYSHCDVLQPANGAPAQTPANACLICQSSVAARLATWGMPYRWLSRWLTTADFKAAAAWAHSLSADQLRDASYDAWPLGEWVRSSVHKHLRLNTIDTRDPHVAALYASYLYSGLLTCLALSRLLAEEEPDALLLFNGRMAAMRIALELGKRQGIRVLVEERSVAPGFMNLFEDTHCLDARSLAAGWTQWKDTPLTDEEIDTVGALFRERWQGQKRAVNFIIGTQAAAEVRAHLSLTPDRPVWVLFTSNLDEIAGTTAQPAVFPRHEDWVEDSVAFAARHPNIQLVIRVHPNSGGTRSFAANPQELAFYDALQRSLPTNVRLVRSDDTLNSYTLAALADVGLTWHSTIGVEMAALGKSVIRCGAPDISAQPCLRMPSDPQDYERMLADLAATASTDALANARPAWRFAYYAFFRHAFAFPLVRQTDWHVGEMNYDRMEALAPGHDDALDRICAHVMDGTALRPAPPTREASVETQESARLRAWMAAVRPGEKADASA